MKTKEILSKCNAAIGGKNKKGIIIGATILFLFAVLIVAVLGATWRNRQFRNISNLQQQSNGRMMGNRGKNIYTSPGDLNNENQFNIPGDASKSGEIAIVVGDLETAKKAVSDAATKNGGNVYATHIDYASGNLRNGSIVVQVPENNFDATFGDLKKVGTKIVQESTQQIPPRYAYPMMAPAAADGSSTQPLPVSDKPSNSTDSKTVTKQAPADQVASPDIAIAPVPNYIRTQPAQDKGYVRVVFVDYGTQINNHDRNSVNPAAAVSNGNNIEKLWLVIILKTAFLLVLIIILIMMLKRIFKSLRSEKKTKTIIPNHHLKLQVKTRPRAVKSQRRKL